MSRIKFGYVFLLVIMCIATLESCSYKEETGFWYGTGSNTVLYALSKNAKDGVLPLNKAGKLEYLLSAPINLRGDYYLELSYSHKNGDGAEGSVILNLGSLSWELPLGFSFLDDSLVPQTLADGEPFLVQYVIPLASVTLEQFTIDWIPKDNNSADNASFAVKSIKLVPRWFGISLDTRNNSLKLSPFVYTADNALVLDPPLSLGFDGDLVVDFQSPGKIMIEGKEKSPGYFKVEGDARETFLIPETFISSESFPLRISGDSISGAELKRKGSPRGQYNASVSFSVPEPIPADPGLVLAWPQDAFRDTRYEVFRWESFPSILIFDFADYHIQDNFLKRLAFYAEKTGFRGRLAPDSEIASLHGWNAHDYRAETLAAFFDLAAKTNFPLLREEKELEAILINAGIIRSSDGTIVAGEGAIISVSRESTNSLRSLFMAHEGFHGLFFIDADFREFSTQRWNALAPVPKAFIINYFQYYGYDSADTYLIINEFMAYILQQSVSQAGYYFGVTLANVIDASEWRRTVLPPKDEASGSWPLLGNAFRIEAEAFSRYVNQRWGLAAGRVTKVTVSN